MPRYRAREPIYLNKVGRLVQTGEVFVSGETPGKAWIAIDPPFPPVTIAAPHGAAAASK